MINNRPLISWIAVPGATSYIVQVKSHYVNWVKQVNGTSLSYPPEQEKLHYGSAFKIVVIANKGDSPISADTLVVHLLPEREVTQINQTVQQVASLGLPPDEVLLDLDTIYMSQGLLNKAIETLQGQIEKGSQDPALYRILGDRYVDAWLPQEAVNAYKKALELATVQGKKDEQVIAQARLRLLNPQSQLPTRMNAAQ
ncbi:hypothetical protein [Nostoc sp. FACHB-280]|uniref:hypothetical protein n=1 Tax=Nostoc sp. FACHB-280 TaxID=2692839 RepID=UPI00168BB3CB|nr:hypothetical protein [Nostoc sp. FACHB-280]MBD2498201.1 hypothetical protein [Nostoc sp. FACHB-280]